MPAGPATAIIYFIGIVVFSSSFTEDGGLHALIPRMSHGEHAKIVAEPMVESHTAFLAFKPCDYVSSKGWAPSALEALPGGLFWVRLDGEQVRFVTMHGTTATEPGPAATEKKKRKELKLPHLRESCCPAMSSRLKESFKPPFDGAAAVIDLRNGVPTACLANRIKDASARVDTQVAMPNDGLLTIIGTKDGISKQIQLRGGAVVFIANTPSYLVEGLAQPTGTFASHFLAYYAMADGGSACKSFECAKRLPLEPCSNQAAWRSIRGDERPGKVLESFDIFDFECSNSQWP